MKKIFMCVLILFCLATLASNADVPTDYIAYWKFETQVGGITPDETGVNNAALIDNAYITNDPERGQVLSLDGDGDYVNFGTGPSGTFTEFTISVWVKINSYADYLKIVDMGAGGTGRRISLGISETPDIYYEIDGGERGHVTWASGPSGWLHLVGTYNGTDIKLYANGTLVAKNTKTPTVSSFTINTGDAHMIGRRITAKDYLNGKMDDVMIYDRALSETEINQIYEGQKPGEPQCLGQLDGTPCDDGVSCTTNDQCISEECVGTPDDSLCPSDTVCADYYCDAALDCQVDYEPATTECRALAGVCDIAEFCTGSSADCPTDEVEPATTECRASAGVCDVAENCDGINKDCPTDAYEPATTECRPAAGVVVAGEVTKPVVGSVINHENPYASDLVAYWLFNEGQGTQAFDLSGNGNTGTLTIYHWATGDPPVWVDGEYGPALEFDGIGSMVWVDDNPQNRPGIDDFTIVLSFWAADEPQEGILVGKRATHLVNWNQFSVFVGYDHVSGIPSKKIGVRITEDYNGGPQKTWEHATVDDIVDGEWHHVVFTRSETWAEVYVDGVLKETADIGISEGSFPFNVNNTQFWGIGDWEDSGGSFKGLIDHVILFRRHFTADDAHLFYQNPYLLFDPVVNGTAGGCDIAEFCTGLGPLCPADEVEPATTECRASAGDCDIAENCDGTSKACPADEKAPAGTECGLARDCTDDQCDGFFAEFYPDGGHDTCDGNGNCIEYSCALEDKYCTDNDETDGINNLKCNAPCDQDEDCAAGEICDLSSCECSKEICDNGIDDDEDGLIDCEDPDCAGQKGPGDVICCQNNDHCNSLDADCADGVCNVDNVCEQQFKSAGKECRAVADVCDVAETCTGDSADCPTDQVQPDTYVCRAKDGDCDKEEKCTGTSATCPADEVEPATTECRASAGVCDVAENCDGVTNDCPADAKAPAGTECGLARDCPDDQCNGFYAEFYPDDGHDTCDGKGICEEYSCALEDSYCTDDDAGDGVDGLTCGAPCDQDSDCAVGEECSNCQCVDVMPTDYIAYWKFETQVGGITPDETGVNNAALVDNAYITNDPERGQVLSLDGDGDYAEASDNINNRPGTSDWSISLWFWAENVNQIAGLVSKYLTDSPYTQFRVMISDDDDLFGVGKRIHLTIVGSSPTADIWWFCTDSDIVDGNWHHIVAMRNSLTGGAIFVDGIAQGLTELRNSPSGMDVDTTVDWEIGVDSPGGSLDFNGKMDDVMIYDRALSETEINQIYEGQKPGEPQCLGQLDGTPCDDGVSCTTNDQCISEECVGTPDDSLCPSDTVCADYYCDAALDCQVDYEPATTECRALAGVCDIAEFCTGLGAACPADAKSTAECRASAGDCDIAENCDGVSNDCPTDDYEPATTECRPAAGVVPSPDPMTKPTVGSVINHENPYVSDLVAYWLFNEGEGTYAFDSSGHGNTGILRTYHWATGDPPVWVAGKYGPALKFDGIGSMVWIDDNPQNRPGIDDFTIVLSFWAADEPQEGILVGKRSTGYSNWNQMSVFVGYAQLESFPSKKTGVRITEDYYAAPPDYKTWEYATVDDIVDGNWHHIVFTRDKNDAQLYVDGVLKEIVDIGVSGGSFPFNVNNTQFWGIGDWEHNAGPFKGLIDHVILFRRHFTADDAHLFYQNPYLLFDPVVNGTAGGCDIAEFCTGSSADCPADEVEPATTECRASAGDCDIAENCDGINKDCPADAYEPAGTECGLARDCPLDQCNGFFAEFYPDDGHDTCDGAGTCEEYSCALEDSYYTDDDETDGVNSLECGAPCDQDSDCAVDEVCQNGECIQPPVFPTDYIAYWKFETQVGGITPDETGVNNAALVDNAYITNDPERGQVLSLDGDGDYAEASDNINNRPRTSDWSISLWFWAADENQAGGLISKKNPSNPYNQMAIYVADNTDDWNPGKRIQMVTVGTHPSRDVWWYYTASDIIDGNWHHLVFVRNQIGGAVYVDGVLQTLIRMRDRGTLPKDIDNTQPWRIGNDNSELYFNGKIDDVMIYNRALSETEINQIYEGQ